MDPVVLTTVGTSLTTVASGIGFALWRYKISRPDQYLIRTGFNIKDMEVSKTGIQWPFQRYMFIEMLPNNYSFNLHAMSSQMMEFILPGVFTIGPQDDVESIKKYARYLSEESTTHMDDLVKGVIEGETRVLAAQMTIDEIFNDRASFKDKIVKNVQLELDQFGLKIYNANIKELQDSPGSEFFQFMRQKTRQEAEGVARVDTSEARKKADIGEKEREIMTRMEVAEYEAQAVEKENESKKRIANSAAELSVVQAEADRVTQIANIEASKQASIREAELQKDVEEKRVLQETEHLRAQEVSKASVDAETQIKRAEGESQSMQMIADANLYQKQKEANSIKAIYNAQSEGIEQLVSSFGGDRDALIKYLMLEKDMYDKLAKTNAEAIQGLNPKITIWNTGNGEKGDNYTDTIKNIGQVIPPLFTTIHEQTGLKPGDWLMNGFDKEAKSNLDSLENITKPDDSLDSITKSEPEQ